MIEFLDKADKELFLEYLNDPSMILMEMANFVGNNVKIYDKKLPFSFFISDKSLARGKHAIRAKIIWNPTKAPSNADGFMMLHGEYDYVSGSHKYKPTVEELSTARKFFKKYKVLFSAVWEEILDADVLQDYMRGRINFKQLLSNINIDEDDPESINYYNINHYNTVEELEKLVRKDSLWNMND